MTESGATERFIRRKDVEKLVGIGCSGIYALMQEQDPALRFPRPIKIGNRSRWQESTVRAWMSRQAECAVD